jgi:DNA repair protein SbcD/Mre11
MRIAHLADLHLGYRAYHRSDSRGFNLREADVAGAFRQAAERVVGMAPDLVVIAGDVFHSVRPSNSAIAEAFRVLSSLRARLPEAPVVMIAGNHDSPRSTETANILTLFREIPGIRVVAEGAERVRLEELDCSVLCLPHTALARQRGAAAEPIAFEPDPRSSRNLLTLHGMITGRSAEEKIRFASAYGGITVADTAIAAERWDYVALGHYHIATELAPNMWYAGGLERTSSNVWMEASAPKGFLEFDVESGTTRFHELDTRPVIDLPRLQATGLGSEEIDERIRVAVEGIAGGLAGKMVRLVIEDLPRQLLRELNHRRLREFKAEALHFHLDPRPPVVRPGGEREASLLRRPLVEQVRDFLASDWELTSPSLQRERLVALGTEYLEQVSEGGEE